MSIKINNERFHYCLAMEMADLALTGINNKSQGMASAFVDPAYFKSRCLSFIRKIRSRIMEITTNDDIFRESLLDSIISLEREIKRVSSTNNNDLEIIACLFRTISLLLGWDFFEGKIYRTPIYHQTEEQHAATLHNLSKSRSPFEIPHWRREIINDLRKKDVPYTQIALILGTSVTNIKQLEKAHHINQLHNKHNENLSVAAGKRSLT